MMKPGAKLPTVEMDVSMKWIPVRLVLAAATGRLMVNLSKNAFAAPPRF